MVLGDALSDPDNVTHLLLLELEICIEHPVLELLLERKLVELHLVLKKDILKRLLLRICCFLEKRPVLSIRLHRCPHSIVVLRPFECGNALREKISKIAVEL